MTDDKRDLDLAEFMRQAIQDGIRRDIAKLANGKQDRDAAESLLTQFCNGGANPKKHRELFNWFSAAFERIIAGTDANEALGLKRKRGQKKRAGEVDSVAIAMYVKLKCQEGMLPLQAKEAAVEFFAREIRTIENALRDVELNPQLDKQDMWRYIHQYRRPQ
jgi:hypothetical protein